MAECTSPVDLSPVPDSIEVSLLEVGEEILEYVVPSFPVFSANLRRIKYMRPTDDTTVYVGFIKDDSSLVGRKYPTVVVVESGCENSFFIESSEVDQSNVRIKNGIFFKNQV